MAIDQDVEELLIIGDSDLIIRQAQGEWETRDVKLIPYRQYVEDLSRRFKSIEFRYIPRCRNELADALATLASMLPCPGNAHIDPLEIQIRERHDYSNTVEAEPNIQPWYHDIKRFLKTKEYLEQASRDQKRTIRRLASGFFLSGESFDERDMRTVQDNASELYSLLAQSQWCCRGIKQEHQEDSEKDDPKFQAMA
ncbi:PREDICTED: uncharacterized protein LOC109234815 [Nicotiana attenuata]|uniref:uncharacterized protein LOC109234815 n=1 Tax=Nicotiana attenuata TaxID=49451 RepID=UPI00090529A6|nr:PREDICTED: uncharacterized protein LOC109234815 [Nicotiana attenuata]